MAIQVDEETYYEIVNGKFIQGTSQKKFSYKVGHFSLIWIENVQSEALNSFVCLCIILCLPTSATLAKHRR